MRTVEKCLPAVNSSALRARKRQGAPGIGSQSYHCFPELLLFLKAILSFITTFETLNRALDPISSFRAEHNL